MLSLFTNISPPLLNSADAIAYNCLKCSVLPHVESISLWKVATLIFSSTNSPTLKIFFGLQTDLSQILGHR